MSEIYTNQRLYMRDEEMRQFFASEDAKVKAEVKASTDEWNTEPDQDSRPERGRAICEDALKTINGERLDQYNNPENSFGKIAALWSAYLGIEVTPTMTADMMCLLKIAREFCGKGKRDNAVDLIGYAALAARMRGYDA
jgi:hypothetical protein